MTTTNRGLLLQKHSNSIQSWSNQFWNPIANFSVKMEYERTSTSALTHRWKNEFAFSDATILTKTMNKKRSVHNVLHFCLNVWEPGASFVCISRSSGVFRPPQARNTNPLLAWPPLSRSSFWLQKQLSKNNYRGKRSTPSKDSGLWKKSENRINGFQKQIESRFITTCK